VKIIIRYLIFTLILSCQKNSIDNSDIINNSSDHISAVDISLYPTILENDIIFFNEEGYQIDFINSLINNGINTIRLRLWVNPKDESASLNQVKEFSALLKSFGFKIWITPHFSDTWAHPGQQEIPESWESLNFSDLKTQVYLYTNMIMNEISPDYIQIGNEINTGFLFPYGNIENNSDQFIELLNQGINAVRENSSRTKIILHYAGFESSQWFFNLVNNVDYDIIGVSFYPIWHGKSLEELQNQLNNLSNSYDKEILIAETAYPFTLGWNDWTNNIVGLEKQLILPDYPASPEGQQNFIRDLKNLIFQVDNGIGFCYWGAELIAWDGGSSENGSVWENQAIFDFNNTELPVLKEFNLN
tara:strand:+ start:42 stop:1118 length:1077 start_codon:yes stop_codon:yes gene_type:complete